MLFFLVLLIFIIIIVVVVVVATVAIVITIITLLPVSSVRPYRSPEGNSAKKKWHIVSSRLKKINTVHISTFGRVTVFNWQQKSLLGNALVVTSVGK